MIAAAVFRGLSAVCALSVMVGMSIVSDRPGSELSQGLPGPTGNLLHVVAFAVLALFLLRALVPLSQWRDPKKSWPGLASASGRWTFVICGVRGLTDEIHQHFVVGRACSLLDLALDLLGAALVLGFPLRGAEGRPRTWISFFFGLVLAVVLAIWGDAAPPSFDGWLDDLLSALD